MRTILAVLALLASTSAYAESDRLRLPQPVGGCTYVEDAARYAELDRKDPVAALKFIRDKDGRRGCRMIPAGAASVLQRRTVGGNSLECIRSDGEADCYWSIAMSRLYPDFRR